MDPRVREDDEYGLSISAPYPPNKRRQSPLHTTHQDSAFDSSPYFHTA